MFLICLADRVLVFGDCAVNPNPSTDELADIAISSAETALGRSGSSPGSRCSPTRPASRGRASDVDAVRDATEIVRERRPDIPVDGPIQYDAAVEPAVAAKKLPGSEVAGRATVLIFPDLETGNIAYKAVQRSANALAIGPVLQGLRQARSTTSAAAAPVRDIVNTVVITAIQAQEARGRSTSRLALPSAAVGARGGDQ